PPLSTLSACAVLLRRCQTPSPLHAALLRRCQVSDTRATLAACAVRLARCQTPSLLHSALLHRCQVSDTRCDARCLRSASRGVSDTFARKTPTPACRRASSPGRRLSGAQPG